MDYNALWRMPTATMTISIQTIEQGLDAFARLLSENPTLVEELAQSGPEFFGGPGPHGHPRDVLLGSRRHLEWFLFERHSPSLFGVPSERLLEPWLEVAPEGLGLRGEVLMDSFGGIFEVGEVRPGVGCWLNDVAGFGSYALTDSGETSDFRTGDFLVGRLYPVEDGVHRASSAIGVYRSESLGAALERDLKEIRAQSGGQVLRLSQHSLERMFWGAGRVPASTDPVGEAQAFFLHEAGLSKDRVRGILAQLKQDPMDSERLVQGAGDTVGAILDELAFETEIALEPARRHLLRAWEALSFPSSTECAPTEVPAGQSGLGTAAEAAMIKFDEGRAAGGDLGALFDQLESDLGVSGGDPEPESTVPDFPGVVGAMIAEFQWEQESSASPLKCDFVALGALTEFAKPIGVFEELSGADLLRFMAFWIHERELLEDSDHARRLVTALEEFCRWVQRAHEHPLLDQFGQALEGLAESLPRIAELNVVLRASQGKPNEARPAACDTQQPGTQAPGELFEICTDEQGRFSHLRDRAGEAYHVNVELPIAERLRDGDRIRAQLSLNGDVTLYRAYPPEAAGLVQGK